MHGSVQSPNGTGKTSRLVSSSKLASLLRAMSEAPKAEPRRFSVCNSAIMMTVAPENGGGLLRSPELSLLEN